MSNRVLLSLLAAVGLVVVLAAGLTRASYTVGGTQVTCPDRALVSAAQSVTDDDPDPCEAAAQSRIFTVAASLMGLVLISGLLSRRSEH